MSDARSTTQERPCSHQLVFKKAREERTSKNHTIYECSRESSHFRRPKMWTKVLHGTEDICTVEHHSSPVFGHLPSKVVRPSRPTSKSGSFPSSKGSRQTTQARASRDCHLQTVPQNLQQGTHRQPDDRPCLPQARRHARDLAFAVPAFVGFN